MTEESSSSNSEINQSMQKVDPWSAVLQSGMVFTVSYEQSQNIVGNRQRYSEMISLKKDLLKITVQQISAAFNAAIPTIKPQETTGQKSLDFN